MKNFITRLIIKRKNIKIIKNQARLLTVALPCVNLYVRPNIKGDIRLFNNDDFIATFSCCEVSNLISLGELFSATFIYCLCIKNSIEKYY